jgi:hypothetical protein
LKKKKRKGLFSRTKPVNKALKFFELRLMNGEFFLLLCNGFQQNVNVSLLCAWGFWWWTWWLVSFVFHSQIEVCSNANAAGTCALIMGFFFQNQLHSSNLTLTNESSLLAVADSIVAMSHVSLFLNRIINLNKKVLFLNFICDFFFDAWHLAKFKLLQVSLSSFVSQALLILNTQTTFLKRK